ncbi:hypothetical protein J6590_012792 [Homalodisca vitripennis]|nr:hypothetical protein J6590_088468 [Homalodisca vitripennis]KAG8327744.1 hypothetical protein J6590_012792 [Homalodisca vitripennis]
MPPANTQVQIYHSCRLVQKNAIYVNEHSRLRYTESNSHDRSAQVKVSDKPVATPPHNC